MLTPLLAVPNVSEGRDPVLLDAIATAFAGRRRARARRPHATPTTTARCSRSPARRARWPRRSSRGARAAVERIDLPAHDGVHPHVGARRRRAGRPPRRAPPRRRVRRGARARRQRSASELALPVYLYGALGRRAHARRAAPRRRGRGSDADRRPTSARARSTRPPARRSSPRGRRSSPSTSSSRPPATLDDARRIAALIREGGEEGLPGVRALGRARSASRRRPGLDATSRTTRRAARGDSSRPSARTRAVARAELVGLAPEAAFAGFPADVALPGFDPDRQLIERAAAVVDSGHGPDEAQAAHQAPRQRGGHGRGARAHAQAPARRQAGLRAAPARAARAPVRSSRRPPGLGDQGAHRVGDPLRVLRLPEQGHDARPRAATMCLVAFVLYTPIMYSRTSGSTPRKSKQLAAGRGGARR